MKFLTLPLIKAQLRIDHSSEDELLVLYGNSAESTLFHNLRRDYDDLMESYGGVPDDIVHAALMLVDASYQHRSVVSPQNQAIIPYHFDLLIKPYVRLADKCHDL